MCIISRNMFKHYYLKNKRLFWLFYCISACAWKLQHFETKDEYPSLIISEMMDCDKGGYFNV